MFNYCLFVVIFVDHQYAFLFTNVKDMHFFFRIRTKLKLVFILNQNAFLNIMTNLTISLPFMDIRHTLLFSLINRLRFKFNFIWERIWEKGPIGNFFTNSIPEKIPF